MMIDGTRFGIGKNLYEALVHLRMIGVTRIWIDAVCINQDDEDERGLQVQLMGDIYRKADEVISWLGIHADDSDVLFQWIEDNRHNGTTIDPKASPPPSSRAALIELAKRPYFSRMWVLQEFALARKVQIMCGKDLEDPGLMSELCYNHAFNEEKGPLAPAEPFMVLKQVREMQQRPMQLGLLDLLRHINSVYDKFDRRVVHTFQSTDFIDQVYGLLGLAYDGHRFVPDPVYTATFTMNNLFEYMTRSIIQHTRRLDFAFLEAGEGALDFKVFGSKDPRGYKPADLPSWCPDYVNLLGSPLNAEILSAVDFSSTPSKGMYAFRHRYGGLRLHWNATRSSQLPDISPWKENFKHMHILGMPVGKILACTSPTKQLDPTFTVPTGPDDNPVLMGLVQLLYTYSSVSLPSVSDAIMALLLALHPDSGGRCLSDTVFHRSFRKRLQESKVYDELKWLFPWAQMYLRFDEMQTMSPEERDRICNLSCQLAESTMRNYDDFQRKVMGFSPNTAARTIVDVAEKHGSFAWVPSAAEAGDEIWLLKGCSMPIVLRKTLCNGGSASNVFVKVGPAIVNGAMDGDMWSESNLESIAIM